jgi:hypothetical protein
MSAALSSLNPNICSEVRIEGTASILGWRW